MDAHHLALSARLAQIEENVAERRQLEAGGQAILRPLPARRPQIMVKCVYSQPDRGYALTLFCGCGIDPSTLDVVEVFVRPGHGQDRDQPAHRDALMERVMDDFGRTVSFLLRLGFSPHGLRDKLASTRSHDDHAGLVDLFDGAPIPVASPLGAVVEAACWAQRHIRKATAAPRPA